MLGPLDPGFLVGIFFPLLAACYSRRLSGPLGVVGSSARNSSRASETFCVQTSALDPGVREENVIGASILAYFCQGFRFSEREGIRHSRRTRCERFPELLHVQSARELQMHSGGSRVSWHCVWGVRGRGVRSQAPTSSCSLGFIPPPAIKTWILRVVFTVFFGCFVS